MIIVHSYSEQARPMKSGADWKSQANGIIRGELKRRNLIYTDLTERLAAIGVKNFHLNSGN